ncbi:MAG TPA: sulfur oxidation c-type cytochrome SoxA [Pelomicrobium sp.]|nr:sulfur oxidation c-type cytochrome SoxA [Pelomicrobium sp.]
MTRLITALAALALVLAPAAAVAAPEQDRQALLQYFQKRYPEIKLEDYVHGALNFSEDSMGQYEAIMDFPPYVSDIEKGKKMWEMPFKNGKTYAGCFPNGGRMVAGNYPYFDDKAGKVVTFEMALNACREANGEAPLAYNDMKTMGVLTAYARTLSDGMKMNIKVQSPAAQEAFERGKKFFFTRHGQLNFSCASCHIQGAGQIVRTEYLSPAIGQATHWPVFRGGSRLVTLQDRYRGCLSRIRAVPLKPGSTEFNDLEYFHSYLSNGLEMQASVFRK